MSGINTSLITLPEKETEGNFNRQDPATFGKDSHQNWAPKACQ